MKNACFGKKAIYVPEKPKWDQYNALFALKKLNIASFPRVIQELFAAILDS